jgi:osmotically-inducible protein OsmY
MNSSIRAYLAAALLVATPVASGCNRQPDVEDQVSKSLDQANLDKVDVEWDKEAKVAHLKGQVDNPAEKQKAEEIATAAVGTTGTVLNELTVEGLSEDTADDMDGQIRDRLAEMIDNDPTLKDRDVDFDVNNGAVTAKGHVRTAAEKQKVGELVKNTPGVKEFANSVEIRADE